MQESPFRDQAGLDADLAKTQIPGVGSDNATLFIIQGKRILRSRVRQVIQRGVHARDEHGKADDKKGENFEKAFHVGDQ